MLTLTKINELLEEAEQELSLCVKNEMWGEAHWWESRAVVLREVLELPE